MSIKKGAIKPTKNHVRLGKLILTLKLAGYKKRAPFKTAHL
jgi:hypothetical protein